MIVVMQEKKNDSTSFENLYDGQGLADYLKVERSEVSAEIGKLRKEGAIEWRRKWFEFKYTSSKSKIY